MNEDFETSWNWQDEAASDRDVWEQNQVDEDMRLERQAEAEADQSARSLVREELLDDVELVRRALEEAADSLREHGNVVKAHEEVRKALDYLRHVEENAGRLS